MEGSTRTRSPQKQQMAAEGAVTRNRSKKDVGAAVVPTRQRRGQSKDNSGGGGGAGKDKGAKGVVAAKDKRARANDDEGALGGNAAVDKCARGGQSKDNSGGGGSARKDKGAKGVVAAKDKFAQANDDEGALGGNAAVDKCARGGGGPTKKQGRKLPTKRNLSPSPLVDAGTLGVIDNWVNDPTAASEGRDTSAAVAGAAGVFWGDASAAVASGGEMQQHQQHQPLVSSVRGLFSSHATSCFRCL